MRDEGGVTLAEAHKLFSNTLTDMMIERGMMEPRFTNGELRKIIACCVSEFNSCWDEFVMWVMHGDDKKERAMDVVRASLTYDKGPYWYL